MRDHTSPGIRSRRRSLAALAVVMPLALVAAACGGDDDDSTATGDAGSGGGDSSGMTVSITGPSDGAEVGEPFDVEFDTSVDIGEPDTGLHHVHLYYDGKTSDGDYDLVYEGTSFTVDRDLGSGEHTIKAAIANPDHSLTDASDEITVNVTDDSGGGGGSGSGGSDDDSDPYGY